MRKIVSAGLKGGTGKTTLAHSLCSALVEEGMRVLLVDLDPQRSLTRACGIQPKRNTPTITQVIMDDLSPLSAVIELRE